MLMETGFQTAASSGVRHAKPQSRALRILKNNTTCEFCFVFNKLLLT